MRRAVLAAAVLLMGCGPSEQAKDASPKITEVTVVPSPSLTPTSVPQETVAASPEIHPSAQLVPPPPGSWRHFQALGTEPFWSFEVAADKLVYSSPEAIKGVTLKASYAADGQGYRYTAMMDGKPLTLLIQPGPCSDGMSDTTYAYTATYTLGAQTERGCARPK